MTTDTATGAGAAWQLEGLDAPVAALRRAIESGHLAHAYLFHGPPGVGKATLARRLAQALVSPPGPDGALDLDSRPARQVEADELPDVERVVVGGICDDDTADRAATATRIRICQVRRLQRLAALAPFQAPRRIFIIDSVNDLQTEAAHALLKVLEEPPPHVLLLLLSHDPEELLPTVRSRCQEIALLPMPVARLAEALEGRAGLEPEQARALAREARGRYGLAIRLLEDPSLRVLQESVAEAVVRLGPAGRNERLDYAEQLSANWRRDRATVLTTLDLWADWWRNVLFEAAGTAGATAAAAVQDGDAWTASQAVVALQALRRAREHLLANVNPQLAIEVMMLDLPTAGGGA